MAEYPQPLTELTTDEIRARLEARTRSIGDRVATLKHELTTVQDITVNGKPVLDHLRAHPIRTAGIALASGLALGLLSGFRARARSRPQLDERAEVVRLYVARMLDDAADLVVGGLDSDEAVDEVISKRPPLVYYAPPNQEMRSTFAETFDVAVKTAMGFGVKFALDRFAARVTGEDELFDAVDRVREDPPV